MNQIVRNVLATLLLGLAVLGCGPSVEDGSVEDAERSLSTGACHYKCQKCPPKQVCSMVCVPSGNCNNSCVETMLCIIGYHFDDKVCKCVPDKGGVTCGNTTCQGGQVCCNASCGICTPPGGVCIQTACAPL
jgi:hypothetical protein